MSKTWWRAKPQGRFVHACKGGCGGFLKARGTHCYACICDLLSGIPAGSWREQEKTERKPYLPPFEVEKTALFI